jgi:hypothetical protein
VILVRHLRRPKVSTAPQFSLCGGCVTPKRCKEASVCDAETVQVSPKGQKDRPAKKVSGGVKKQVSQSRRAKEDGSRVQAR